MGCLRRVIGALGCLVILAVAALAVWVFRDRLAAMYHRLRGGARPPAPVVYAPPAPGGAARADSALARLSRRGGPAYVDLTAGELAALIVRELGSPGRRVFDSVAVALGDQRVSVRGSLEVSRLPRRLLGPLADGLGRREPLVAGGTLGVDPGGRMMWTIDELKVRDFPFPRSVMPAIVHELGLAGARGAAVPIPIPQGRDGRVVVGDVRVTAARVRLYRASPR